MPEIVVVTGTTTEVGKTWLAVRLIQGLRDLGAPVAARKPVQSFEPDTGATDAERLAAASGESVQIVTPDHRSYPLPMAPPIAADRLGLPGITVADLAAELQTPDVGVLLVEGVGGPRSPLAHDGDTITLADAIGAAALVLVSPAGLGAINAVRLCLDAIAPRPVIVFLNRFDERDDLCLGNLEWLERDGANVVTEVDELVDRLAPPGR